MQTTRLPWLTGLSVDHFITSFTFESGEALNTSRDCYVCQRDTVGQWPVSCCGPGGHAGRWRTRPLIHPPLCGNQCAARSKARLFEKLCKLSLSLSPCVRSNFLISSSSPCPVLFGCFACRINKYTSALSVFHTAQLPQTTETCQTAQINSSPVTQIV